MAITAADITSAVPHIEKTPITEMELMKFKVDQETLKKLNSDVRKLEPKVKAQAAGLMARIEAGAPIQSENLSVTIDHNYTRRVLDDRVLLFQAWREAGIVNPEAHYATMLADATPKVYPRVIVQEVSKPAPKRGKKKA
ncbi:hypothetical protein [Myxococcus phage Mx1]|nr:hypothetical protein [Myxococcus phage Mx1]